MAARFDDWACFSAQQAAEKALKGVLQRLGVEAWGHSVVDLLDEVATSQEVPQGLRDAALELDKAYTPTRTSPGHPAAATPRSKRQGSWTMPRGSSGSVKVFYPRYSRAGLIRLLEGAGLKQNVAPPGFTPEGARAGRYADLLAQLK